MPPPFLSFLLCWQVALADDPFGAALLAAGAPEEYVKAGTVDPQVTMPDGSKGSLFDALEDMDSADCVAKLVELSALA